MDEEIKRWTARRKSALVLEIIQGKMTVAEASRQFDRRGSTALPYTANKAFGDERFRRQIEALVGRSLEVRSRGRPPAGARK